jgi:hypothetical protein
VTMHHIVSDFWSIGIFTSEVSAGYAALVRDRQPELPVLPLQYAEYARWQHDWLRGPVLEDLLAYWRGNLLGASPQLDLPLDRPRPLEPRFEGARQPLRVGRSLTADLKQLARATDSSLFIVLAAAFALLLRRWTGQEDLSFGTPVANRDRLPVGQLVGCFINAVALRIDLSGDPPFHELLERTRQTAQAAFAHQDLPFERLVAALNPARQQSHWPLFQVVFNYQSASLPPLDLPGLRAEFLDVESDLPTKYDFTFYLREEQEEVVGALAYQTGLFDPKTARWITDSYKMLLHGIVASQTKRLSRYELAAERRVEQSSRLVQSRRRVVWVGATEESAPPGENEAVGEDS